MNESDEASKQAAAVASSSDDSLPNGQRIVVSLLGTALLVAGAIATFVTSNGAGSAALLAGGLGLIVLAFLGDRIASFKFAGVEATLRKVNRLYTQAADFDAAGLTDEADKLRARADHLLLEVAPDARAYENLRRIEPAGPGRTRRLYDTVHKAEQFARERRPNTEFVRTLFDKGEDGDRVFALVLMREDPSVADMDAILDAIEHSRSAFEQYQALAAAEEVLPQLNGEPLEFLEEALVEQTGPRGWINDTTDRWGAAQRMLAAINSRSR